MNKCVPQLQCESLWIKASAESLKGYFTYGKMNIYLKWVIYVEEMCVYIYIYQ